MASTVDECPLARFTSRRGYQTRTPLRMSIPAFASDDAKLVRSACGECGDGRTCNPLRHHRLGKPRGSFAGRVPRSPSGFRFQRRSDNDTPSDHGRRDQDSGREFADRSPWQVAQQNKAGGKLKLRFSLNSSTNSCRLDQYCQRYSRRFIHELTDLRGRHGGDYQLRVP